MNLLTPSDVARFLEIDVYSVYREVLYGSLPPPIKVGNIRRFHPFQLAEYVARMMNPEERTRYRREFGGVKFGGTGQYRIPREISLMLQKFDAGWNPFAQPRRMHTSSRYRRIAR
ncbi:helix-turn-helix domain-containing protein [Nibricoccus sp. IMCC34717]|uniref:helix-turn-helix domain-containing protein n=1 Tax=Nibricoccus sp. IMCC34717 TaxID=3034021 RepID=UPI00384AD0CF